MKSNYLELTFSKVCKIVLRFFAGAAIGMGMVLLAYLHYSSYTSEIGTIQIVGSAVFITVCGALPMIYGNKILAILAKIFSTMS